MSSRPGSSHRERSLLDGRRAHPFAGTPFARGDRFQSHVGATVAGFMPVTDAAIHDLSGLFPGYCPNKFAFTIANFDRAQFGRRGRGKPGY